MNFKDGKIKYEDFEKYMVKAMPQEEDQLSLSLQLLKCFKELDPEKSGFVSKIIIEETLKRMGIEDEEFMDAAITMDPIHGEVVLYVQFIEDMMKTIDEAMEELNKPVEAATKKKTFRR